MHRGATSRAGTRWGVVPLRKGPLRRIQLGCAGSPDVPASTTDITAGGAVSEDETLEVVTTPKAWPCGDKLDKAIILLSVPAIINFLIVPFTGACDTFWVGRMGDAMKIAAQGSANQIFSTTFWVLGFLPSVITPLIARVPSPNFLLSVQSES
ncbi:hypothetical protein T484DRAFT_1611558 [Baffinella frigidus]|nr:hypothetical protein T484DRAFT_1611558 [Cryptophyta sp. CCMP2293]